MTLTMAIHTIKIGITFAILVFLVGEVLADGAGANRAMQGLASPRGEAVAEPVAIPEQTSGAEPESEPETTSEPTSGAEPESEPEAIPEPTSGAEPESEPEGTAKPELESKPESEVKPEVESEGEATPEAEVEPAPESEPEAEDKTKTKLDFPDTEPNVAPEERPTYIAIVMPPTTLLVLIFAGILFLFFLPRIRNANFFCRPSHSVSRVGVAEEPEADAEVDKDEEEDERCDENTDDALEIQLQTFFNKPGVLLKIAMPAIMSLAFCPLVLYTYVPMVQFFWPRYQQTGIPLINEALACFLAPAGFVYALTFAFCLKTALGKQRGMVSILSQEIAFLDQIVIMTSRLHVSLPTKLTVYNAIKADLVSIALQIQNKKGHTAQDYIGDEASGQTWKCLKKMEEEITASSSGWNIEHLLYEKILGLLTQLNLAASERVETQQVRIHPLMWLFLELLGLFSFFGILLLRTYSEKLDLTICIITVFSITMLCYVISDIDAPFSGFLRVDVSGLTQMISKVRYLQNRLGLGVDVQLPDLTNE